MLKGNNNTQGFTLIEVLLVIAILAILAAVVIVAINPGKQFSEAQDAQRRSDIRSILDAVHQYAIDNQGTYPGDIPTGASCIEDGLDICKVGFSCDGIRIDDLITDEKYLTNIPSDPAESTDQGTSYRIIKTPGGRISVCAPFAYTEDEEMVVTR